MDCVTPILNIVTRLWDCTANRAVYIRDLKENLKSLWDLKNELENISKDVAEQQQYSSRTNQVKGWLETVQLKLKEVDIILQKGDEEIQQKCLGSCCPRHCCTSYRLGKQVIKKIDVVTKLIEKGSSLVVVDKVPRPMIDEMPMEKTVEMESSLDEVWKFVEDHKVRIIGLYGMGGVGKTTLLKKLNNKFLETSHNFDAVIWVVVSKEVKLDKIQETILNKFGIPKDMWIDRSEEERAAQILKRLRNKRFVLLLDDLWDRLELSKLGVSFSNNQNEFKIVFTTRSGEVCGKMEVDAGFKLTGLSKEAALKLFRQKVGEDVLNSHHELPKLAEIVAGECDGLPLALVTIGRAMASRKIPEDWRYAIKVLKSYPSQFPEMGKYVFPTLRFSYDSLSDDTLKNCFLYCSTFPEDRDISNRELIKLWIGEGFLDDFDNTYEAQERGRFIINSLKLACLLEGSDKITSYEEYDYVKMHDVLRDMAHWLAREHENDILVKEHTGLIKSQEIGRWKEAVRVSLYGDSTEFLIKTPVDCPRLQTIVVMGSKLTTLPGTLFQSIHTLTVLNLSNNENLRELPVEICALISLRYLNLSNTCLNKLPIEVKNLTQLRILLLDEMRNLVVIPPGVLSCLSSLQMFSNFNYMYNNRCKIVIEELECLEKITDVGLTFKSVSPVLKFMSSGPKLQSCITRLSISYCTELRSLDISRSTMRRMEHLEELRIRFCDNLREVKICFENGERMQRSELNCFRNLQIISIELCAMMEDLSWLIYTPRLRLLYVSGCKSLEEIITWDFAGSSEIEEAAEIFSNLEKVYLCNLPKLKSICRQAMPFPSLQKITVSDGCKSLRKLPFNAQSAKSTFKAIEGRRDWWNKLEWEDEATKLAFASKFHVSVMHPSIKACI